MYRWILDVRTILNHFYVKGLQMTHFFTYSDQSETDLKVRGGKVKIILIISTTEQENPLFFISLSFNISVSNRVLV